MEIAAVVLTSNRYVHLMPAFAHFWNRAGLDWIPVTVVHYDVYPDVKKLPDNFNLFCAGAQSDTAWSDGLIAFLDSGRCFDQFILMLEDYWLTRVDRYMLMDSWSAAWLCDKFDLTEEVAKFGYCFNPGDALIYAQDESRYQASLQAAIWSKSFLREISVSGENPWRFEDNATRRIIALRRLRRVLICANRRPALEYVNAVGGQGNKPGILDSKKIPAWMLDEIKQRNLI